MTDPRRPPKLSDFSADIIFNARMTFDGVTITGIGADSSVEKTAPMTMDAPEVVAALRDINGYRARNGRLDLDPLRPSGQLGPWTPQDVISRAADPDVRAYVRWRDGE